MSMEDARNYCQQRHGDLVSITSKDENTFLWKQVGIFACLLNKIFKLHTNWKEKYVLKCVFLCACW